MKSIKYKDRRFVVISYNTPIGSSIIIIIYHFFQIVPFNTLVDISRIQRTFMCICWTETQY